MEETANIRQSPEVSDSLVRSTLTWVGLQDGECLAVLHPPNKYQLIVPAFLAGLLVLDVRTTVKEGPTKAGRWKPCNHSRHAHPRASLLLCALGGEGTQPTSPPRCGWGKASCRKWLSKLKEEGEAPASGELAFRDVARREGTATWLLSVLSLEDVLLIPGASTVYFK